MPILCQLKKIRKIERVSGEVKATFLCKYSWRAGEECCYCGNSKAWGYILRKAFFNLMPDTAIRERLQALEGIPWISGTSLFKKVPEKNWASLYACVPADA